MNAPTTPTTRPNSTNLSASTDPVDTGDPSDATGATDASDPTGPIDPQLLHDLLAHARRHGATDGDVIAVAATDSEVRVRMGEVEQVSRSEQHTVGLRLFVGRRSAIVSGNDLRRGALVALVERGVAAARQMDEDPDSRVASVAELSEPVEDLALFDSEVAALEMPALIDLARRAEDAARAADARIRNSEGGEASASSSTVRYATMAGSDRSRRGTSVGVVAVPVAVVGDDMEVDYWYASRRRLADLPAPEQIGQIAAKRVLRRLGTQPVATGRFPVIFEAPVMSRVLADFASAISGEAVARKTSYLVDRLGSQVAHPSLTIVDNPHVDWGVASRSFDGEGFATRPTTVVADGVLQTYLTNLRTAACIGTAHSRHASRGPAGPPGVSPSHFHLGNGDRTLAELLREAGTGLLVTGMMGHGTDLVTGTFSQGVNGLWFVDGEVRHAVREITVAGSLDGLMRAIVARADDLDLFHGVSSPSVLVESMTVAGAG